MCRCPSYENSFLGSHCEIAFDFLPNFHYLHACRMGLTLHPGGHGHSHGGGGSTNDSFSDFEEDEEEVGLTSARSRSDTYGSLNNGERGKIKGLNHLKSNL